MMRIIARGTLGTLCFAVLLASSVPTARAGERCTTSILKGAYGFSFSGFVQEQGSNVPFSGIGSATLDGEGNASATITASENGNLQTFPWTGSYVVNPDCTGSATSTNGNANFSLVVLRSGAEFLGVATNPGSTWTIDFKK